MIFIIILINLLTNQPINQSTNQPINLVNMFDKITICIKVKSCELERDRNKKSIDLIKETKYPNFQIEITNVKTGTKYKSDYGIFEKYDWDKFIGKSIVGLTYDGHTDTFNRIINRIYKKIALNLLQFSNFELVGGFDEYSNSYKIEQSNSVNLGIGNVYTFLKNNNKFRFIKHQSGERLYISFGMEKVAIGILNNSNIIFVNETDIQFFNVLSH